MTTTRKRIETVGDLVDELGGSGSVASWLGVRQSAVCNWVSDGQIPAGWHLRLFLECLRLGVEVDPAVFGVTECETRVVTARFFRRGRVRHLRREFVQPSQ